MAETASILSPDKTVLIADLGAGCSLSDSIDADQLRAWKAAASRRPGRHVRQHLGGGQGRDRLLLHLVERRQGGRAHLARARPRHRDPLRPRHVARRLRRARDRPDAATPSAAPASTSGTGSATSTPASGPRTSRAARAEHPEAEFLIHPECGCSTQAMEYVAVRRRRLGRRPHALDLAGCSSTSRRTPTATYIVATENGMLHPLQKAAPQAKLVEANRMAFCKYMKMITLPKVRDSLKLDVRGEGPARDRGARPSSRSSAWSRSAEGWSRRSGVDVRFKVSGRSGRMPLDRRRPEPRISDEATARSRSSSWLRHRPRRPRGPNAAALRTAADRIVGGATTTTTRTPGRRRSSGTPRASRAPTSQRQFCGGTLLTPRIVQTAAHCLRRPR